MVNSVLKKDTRDYLYREGNNIFMSKEYLTSEVMFIRHITNEVLAMSDGTEVYTEADANEIIEELWLEMVKKRNAYPK